MDYGWELAEFADEEAVGRRSGAWRTRRQSSGPHSTEGVTFLDIIVLPFDNRQTLV
jgi:hypothetical protein